MHVVAPEEASTCKSNRPKRGVDRKNVRLRRCERQSHGKISTDGSVEHFESRPHNTVCFFCEERTKLRNGNSRSCRRCCLVTKVARRECKGNWQNTRSGRRGRRRNRGQESNRSKKLFHASRRRSVSIMVTRRPYKDQLGQGAMRSWGCSHIENGEDEESWREGCQMAAQWKRWLGTTWDRRELFEGGGHAKDARLMVHEHMSQSKGVKRRKEKRKYQDRLFNR